MNVEAEVLRIWQAVSYLQGQMYILMAISLASFGGTCALFVQNWRKNGKSNRAEKALNGLMK